VLLPRGGAKGREKRSREEVPGKEAVRSKKIKRITHGV